MSEEAASNSAVETSNETNVDVTANETTDGNYHSFDDLESQDTRSDAQVMKEAVKEVKESNEKVIEEVKESKNTPSEAKAEDQDLQQEMSDSVTEELIEEIKKLEGRYGEESYELPEDVVFKAKIDGEEVDVSLKDLKANYSGKVAWDKKFQELGTEKKQFTEEKTLIENYVMTFGELVSKGDKLGAMQYLAQLSGQNPLEFRQQLRDQILNEYKQLNEMDEAQRKAFELQEENEFLKQSKESEARQREAEQSKWEVQQRQADIQEALEIDDDAWENARNELIEAGQEASELTPDFIGEYVYALKTFDRAESLLATVDESYATEQNINDLGDIILQNSDFSDEDLVDIIRESLGEPAAKKSKVSKKAAASAKKKDEPSDNSSYKERLKASKIDQFYSFDQLED